MQRKVFGLMLGVLLVAAIGSVGAQTVDPATVVAKVNNEEVRQEEVDFIFNTFALPQVKVRNQGKDLADEQKKQISLEIVNRLVMQKLLLQTAVAAKVAVDESVITQQLEGIKAQRQDIPAEKLKDLIRVDLTIQKLIEQEVASKVTVADDEVQKAYEQNKEQYNEPEQVQASHILAQVKPDAPQAEKDAAKKKIETAQADLKAGKDFAEMAKQYSDDPGSKEKGGDLGFFGRGMMIKPFEDTAFAMTEGQVSDVVETQFGYHIIKLIGKKAARQIPFEEAKENLKTEVLQQKRNAEINKWITGLKEKAAIEIVGQAKPEEAKPEEAKPEAPKPEEKKAEDPKPEEKK